MFEGDVELLQDFVVESTEGLAEIESNLMSIEDQGANIDVDLVNKVFRAIHSIKGAAGFLGLERLAELAHSLENVLSLIRSRQLVPTTAVVEPLLKGSDTLRRMLADVIHSNSWDVSAHVTTLAAVAEGTASSTAQPGDHSNPSPDLIGDTSVATATTLSLDSAHLAAAVECGQTVFVIDWRPAEDLVCRDPEGLLQTLRDTGELIATTLPEGAEHETVRTGASFQVAHATILTAPQLAAFFQIPVERIREVPPAPSDSTPLSPAPAASDVTPTTSPAEPIPTLGTAVASTVGTSTEQASSGPAATASSLPGKPAADTSVTPGSASASSPARDQAHGDDDRKPLATDANIRVAVSVLDRLMNLAGELVLGRNQLLQTLGGGDLRAIESVSGRIDQITTDLQETIMRTRMQPVGNVLGKFTRVVRDLSRQLGKQVQLEIEGKEVELDKTIIESIGDPLTHLVRNSLDHGIESPAVRAQAGKTTMGTVRLRALHQEGKVLLVVEDDGAGIDAAKLKRKAVEKGLITADVAEAMTQREALQLIFAPGFSTAEQVTAVSGRGVGMDVVKTNFERLGGHVEIDTVVGRGTTITVRLPLTLAIIPSLITSCGGQRFAVPQGNIRELVRVGAAEHAERISRVNRSEVLRLRGTLLPLVRLDSVLTRTGPSTGSNGSDDSATKSLTTGVTNIVVVETGRLRYGLVVDRLHDSEEIVVKPLGRHLKGIRFLAGSTVLGDGRVAMILDVGGLARRSKLSEIQDRAARSQHAEAADRQEAERIPTLLFTNHPREWFGVPMSVVSRIERVRAEQIDSVAGREVLQYRGNTLTLVSLENCVPARPRPDQTMLNIIVFKHGTREMGLIAPTVVDIRELPSEIDTGAFKAPGVLGSLIVDGHTLRFLDVFDLGNTQHAVGRAAADQNPATTGDAAQPAPTKPRILYAEDSTFFRNKVTRFMEAEGWQVLSCEDGQIAWDRLSDPQVELDLIITDIEMPNLDGFALTERIRASDRWANIPVIAVTSLASDTDRAHGIAAGVTEYMVKLNREQLIAAVSKILGLAVAHSD
jgi:two-component system, chemotaxis family, sensor kinase CheA